MVQQWIPTHIRENIFLDISDSMEKAPYVIRRAHYAT